MNIGPPNAHASNRNATAQGIPHAYVHAPAHPVLLKPVYYQNVANTQPAPNSLVQRPQPPILANAVPKPTSAAPRTFAKAPSKSATTKKNT